MWLRTAVGYNSDEGGVAPDQELGWENPAGGMYSSPRDLSTLVANFMAADDRYNVGPPVLFYSHVLRKMLQPRFINPDDVTGFGTPFENFWISNYLVRTKAGNIDGFSDVIGVVPELQLGFTLNFNADVETFNITAQLLEILIPGLTNVLLTMQPGPVPSPNPSALIGNYALGSVLIQVFADSNGTLYQNSTSSPVLQPLTYFGHGNLYQIVETLNTINSQPVTPCLEIEAEAEVNEFFEFSDLTGPNGEAQTISIPGYYYGDVFTRVNTSY